MAYNLKTLADHNLKQLYLVLNDLIHKKELLGKSGPISITNSAKGVSKDEQYLILTHLNNETIASLSNDEKSIWIGEGGFNIKSFKAFTSEVQNEFNKRFVQAKQYKKVKPHYDSVNGFMHIQSFEIKIRIHDEDTKQNQLLTYIIQ